MSERVLALQWR